MKKLSSVFLFLILFVFFAVNAFADLATDVESRYNGITSWSADFDQTTYVKMLKQKIRKKGRIAVARPKKLRIEYTSKSGRIYASNGKKLWIYKNDSPTAYQFSKPKKVISKEAWSFLGGA